MSSKKPEGKRHKSVSTKMEWKALEVVHPMPQESILAAVSTGWR